MNYSSFIVIQCLGQGTYLANNCFRRFLLARLHLDLLATKTTLRRLKIALSSLPKALDDSYDEAMTRLQGQNEDEYQLARKVLFWIICSGMPLNLRMLQHALAVETLEDTCLDHESVPAAELIISVCAGMVVIQPSTGIVELVHYTAQEYLERKASKYFPEAHEQMLHACITYLSFDEFRKGPCDSDERLHQLVYDYPLLPYASRYWGFHVNEGSCEEENQKLILDFIRDQQTVRSFTQVETWIQTSDLRDVPHRSPLHVASSYGLRNTVRILLDEGVAPAAALDSWGNYPLHEARDEKIAAMLLNHGADINCTDVHHRTPLMYSAWRGDEAVMSLFLQSGADIKLCDLSGNNALQEAVQKSRDGTSRLLLDAGIEPDARNSINGYTSLHIAAKYEDITLINILLSHGADPTKQNYLGKSPIQLAASRGHEKSTQLLLDAVAKVHPPEHFATIVEKEGIVVKRLMGYAKLDELDPQGRSALMLACEDTWRHGVRLLEHGADTRITDVQGRTCLHHAAAIGSCMTINLLLSEGLDPNSADKDGWTSLHWAAKGGKTANMELLLEGGADPLLKTKDEWTLSKIALYHDRASVVAYLQDEGASELPLGSHEARDHLSEWLVANIAQNSNRTEAFTRSLVDCELTRAICDGCNLVSFAEG